MNLFSTSSRFKTRRRFVSFYIDNQLVIYIFVKKNITLPIFLAAFSFLFFENKTAAQGFAWGPKGGLTIGQQKWDGSLDRDLLFKYHGALFIESLGEESRDFSLFAQIGYHVKGSAVRYRYSFSTGGQSQLYKREYKFENIGLTVGGKKRVPLGNLTSYYSLGLRGEFNLRNNLEAVRKDAGSCELLYLPYDDGKSVKNVVGGFTLGAGIEFPFTELIGGFIEASVQPDFTRQYHQPPINNIINPCSWNNNPGQSVNLPERQIRNVALEVSVGFRFLRKIEYID